MPEMKQIKFPEWKLGISLSAAILFFVCFGWGWNSTFASIAYPNSEDHNNLQNSDFIINESDNIIINLDQTLSLNGTVSDDGNPCSYLSVKWAKISGPGTVNFSYPSMAKTNATFSEAGTYNLQLSADDGAAKTVSNITVTVNNVSLPPNAAQGKMCTASTTLNSWEPWKAIDNNLNTGWSSNSNEYDWWQVDLGSAKVIKRIELVARQDIDQSVTRRNIAVQASNDSGFSTYTVLETRGCDPFDHTGTWVVNVSNTSAYRYIRLVKTLPGYSFIAEVRVFGDSANRVEVESFKIEKEISVGAYKDITETGLESGTLKVTVSLSDSTSMGTHLVVMGAVCDDKTLKEISIVPGTIPSGNSDISFHINVPLGLSKPNMKILIWDNLSSMRALTNPVIITGGTP